ncbi:hypothetical protein [Pseudomonas sp. GL-RE-29]|uniref:hypothetical protein n=1 Tax=Pseudomonas sp. GL-RE-29 TaxID=2832375 RepID=UPI001CC09144|nr:hypothetical protein [Pseudomonas sp. GL-RE-29]
MRDLVCFFDQQLIDSLNSCVLALLDPSDGVGALARVGVCGHRAYFAPGLARVIESGEEWLQ